MCISLLYYINVSISLMHRYRKNYGLNFHGFIFDGKFLIKLQVRGTALLKPVLKDLKKKMHIFNIRL